MGTTTREFDWREVVEKLDDDNRHQESLYPVVYVFSNSVKRRDSGPSGAA